ncbi:MAG TPA: hypothetical protein DIU07_11030 [Rhodobacteraceae bacterium]|nr:hypothetical protein [Paracoccaceae bacterium]
MATFNAFFKFDIDLLNLNWFIDNLESYRLDQNVFDPWEDRYSTFTPDEALVLHGSSFRYDAAGQMYKGTVEAVSQWFYDDDLLAWTEAFLLSQIEVPSLDVYNASQTASTGDDFALLAQILSGDDLIAMSMFDDNMRGFDGADTMFGFGGSDTLSGDEGNDELRGGSGNDKLLGGLGKDNLRGGADNDTLRGGDDGDRLNGGNGKDKLFGDDGNDVLFGVNGNDILRGGAGNDVLRGGAGRDKVFGGSGEDLFQFKTGDGIDIIKDFDVGFLNHDRIGLSGLKSVSNWKDLKMNHMEQDGDDVVIDGGNGDMLILQDTDIGNLVKMFFDF